MQKFSTPEQGMLLNDRYFLTTQWSHTSHTYHRESLEIPLLVVKDIEDPAGKVVCCFQLPRMHDGIIVTKVDLKSDPGTSSRDGIFHPTDYNRLIVMSFYAFPTVHQPSLPIFLLFIPLPSILHFAAKSNSHHPHTWCWADWGPYHSRLCPFPSTATLTVFGRRVCINPLAHSHFFDFNDPAVLQSQIFDFNPAALLDPFDETEETTQSTLVFGKEILPADVFDISGPDNFTSLPYRVSPVSAYTTTSLVEGYRDTMMYTDGFVEFCVCP